MAVDLLLPKLGVEMEGGRIVEWLVAPGGAVTAGQVVASLETEKVVYDLEAPADGFLVVVAPAAVDLVVGDLLARVLDGDELATAATADGPTADGSTAATADASTDAVTDRAAPPPPFPPAVAGGPSPQSSHGAAARRAAAERRRGEPLASPAARRLAKARGVDLTTLRPPSGGAIRLRHVQAAIDAGAASPAPTAATTAPAGTGGTRVEVLGGMRATIARRMHASLQESAQLTDIREHVVTDLVRLRTDAAARSDALGYRLTYTDLAVKAAALALREVPELNATVRGEEVTAHDDIAMGVAVALPDGLGLVAPVLHQPDRLTLREIHLGLADLVDRARARQLTATDLDGGTFTLTNFGSYGTHIGTPILVPGQVAILGIGALLERPVVVDGAVAVGTVLHTSLTIDHRIVDGETAGRFQSALGRYLSDPQLLLLR